MARRVRGTVLLYRAMMGHAELPSGRSTLTVLFEAPFWVGICERFDADGYTVAKFTFGAEPKDYEVYALVCSKWHTLRFSAPGQTAAPDARRISPKRLQREIRASLRPSAVSTRAQQALQLQREQAAASRKQHAQAQKQADADRKFLLRQQKKRAKHRGK